MTGSRKHVLILGEQASKREFAGALARRGALVTVADLGSVEDGSGAEARVYAVDAATGTREEIERERIEPDRFSEWVQQAAVRIGRNRPLTHIATLLELYVETAASVASCLGLPGLRPDRAVLLRDKGRMRELGVPMPQSEPLQAPPIDEEVGRRLAKSLRLPWVLKPARATKSLGIRVVDDVAQLPKLHEDARRQLSEEYVRSPCLGRRALEDWLVTTLVTGTELEADVYVERGRIVWRAVMQKTINERRDGGFEEARSVCPPLVDVTGLDEVLQLLATQVYEIVARPSGVERFLIYPELMWDPGTGAVYLLEVAYRNAGGQCPMLVKHAYGVDTFDLAAACALGEAPKELPSIPLAAAAGQILYTTKPGKFVGIRGIDAVVDNETIFGETWESPGRDVSPVVSYLGYVLAIAPTPGEAERRLDATVSRLGIDIDTGARVESLRVLSRGLGG